MITTEERAPIDRRIAERHPDIPQPPLPHDHDCDCDLDDC